MGGRIVAKVLRWYCSCWGECRERIPRRGGQKQTLAHVISVEAESHYTLTNRKTTCLLLYLRLTW